MMWLQYVLAFVLFCGIFIKIEGYRFEPNVLHWTNNTGCPDDEQNPVHFYNVVTRISGNKYRVNGEITINKTINGPIGVGINL